MGETLEIGDRIRIKRAENVYEGILMPTESDADIISLKLDNGYNVGFDKDSVAIELIEAGRPFSATMPKLEVEHKDELPDVAILGTGGTVASKIDYKTGAVYPAFSPEELLMLVPELSDLANIDGKEVLSVVSEDLRFEDWKKIGKYIFEHIENDYDGIVVTHGTDTLHYTTSMMSFMLCNLPIPIVFVGAQRSSDRPSSDAAFNLISAVNFSSSDCKEVVLCMHANMNDEYSLAHRGTRVRKFHTSRRDAFQTINGDPIARVYGDSSIEFLSEYRDETDNDPFLDTKVEDKVALIKTYPETRDILPCLVDKGYRGIIIEGTGLGHAPDTMHEDIRRGIEEGIVFGMTSQCIHGRVNMNVYRGGRTLKEMGVMPLGDMLSETAWCKLCFALGHHSDPSEVRDFMLTNIHGEISPRSALDAFRCGM